MGPISKKNVYVALCCLVFAMAGGRIAQACGWWGDGEVTMGMETPILTSPEGEALEQDIGLRSAKLPGEMGYGVAVPEPGQAVPYLLTTFGRPVNKIGELKTFGYVAVIDLGTPDDLSVHQSETRAAGMTYYNLPIADDMPTEAQVTEFRNIVVSSGNSPLLVYAPEARLLGVMWAAYRLSFGAPLNFALSEGRDLGLTEEQERGLIERYK